MRKFYALILLAFSALAILSSGDAAFANKSNLIFTCKMGEPGCPVIGGGKNCDQHPDGVNKSNLIHFCKAGDPGCTVIGGERIHRPRREGSVLGGGCPRGETFVGGACRPVCSIGIINSCKK